MVVIFHMYTYTTKKRLRDDTEVQYRQNKASRTSKNVTVQEVTNEAFVLLLECDHPGIINHHSILKVKPTELVERAVEF